MEFMKNSYSNSQQATLMSWPTSPAERKGSFEICLYVKKDFEINPTDEIKCSGAKETISVYTIVEVLEKRPATVKGFEFVRAQANWHSRKLK